MVAVPSCLLAAVYFLTAKRQTHTSDQTSKLLTEQFEPCLNSSSDYPVSLGDWKCKTAIL
jgi:hypothetical protein